MEIALTIVGMLLAFVLGALTSNPALLDKVFKPSIKLSLAQPDEPVSEEKKALDERERKYAEQYANMMAYVGKPQVEEGDEE